jgi:hypothetical protein
LNNHNNQFISNNNSSSSLQTSDSIIIKGYKSQKEKEYFSCPFCNNDYEDEGEVDVISICPNEHKICSKCFEEKTK